MKSAYKAVLILLGTVVLLYSCASVSDGLKHDVRVTQHEAKWEIAQRYADGWNRVISDDDVHVLSRSAEEPFWPALAVTYTVKITHDTTTTLDSWAAYGPDSVIVLDTARFRCTNTAFSELECRKR